MVRSQFHTGRVAAMPPDRVSSERKVARILLADAEPASRGTLETLLNTAGYAVDSAATSGEALNLLDAEEYQLVLADLRSESGESGARLLAYARQKEFRPATALISSELSELDGQAASSFPENPSSRSVGMTDDNISFLLARVAHLIGARADRRMRRHMLRAS